MTITCMLGLAKSEMRASLLWSMNYLNKTQNLFLETETRRQMDVESEYLKNKVNNLIFFSCIPRLERNDNR